MVKKKDPPKAYPNEYLCSVFVLRQKYDFSLRINCEWYARKDGDQIDLIDLIY